VAPFDPVYPALHMQLVLATAPLSDVEKKGQFMQFALPTTSLYLPTMHALHVLVSCPVYPALHTHERKATECESTGQFVQGADPRSVLYVPESHCTHGEIYPPVYAALHRHLTACTATEFSYGQLWHRKYPNSGLILPLSHASQLSPSSPLYPGLH